MRLLSLPEPVAAIYEAVARLSALYPERKFTLDGHLVGSIGEVVAAAAFGLRLHPNSHPSHDAYNEDGNVQIKMTAGRKVAMYDTCERLIVLRIVTPTTAEVVYDGPGDAAWEAAGKRQKNGQKTISLSELRSIGSRIDASGRMVALQPLTEIGA